MNKEDIIKYSQQIVLYKSPKEYLIANGFFVRYDSYFYFITVNHAIEPNFYYEGDAHLILHIKGEGLTTKTIRIANWHFIDLYKLPDDGEKYFFPRFERREDFAFCSIIKENMKENINTLPYLLSKAAPTSCHHKKFACIQLPKQLTVPDSKKKYHVAGMILKQPNEVRWTYIEDYYDMIYYNTVCDNIYEFKIQQPTTEERMKGLSGSPVFDEDLNFVGMSIRYDTETNKLTVLSAVDIAYYLKNDGISMQEEI